MGILIVMGMMSSAAGLCCLFQRIDRRSTRVPVIGDPAGRGPRSVWWCPTGCRVHGSRPSAPGRVAESAPAGAGR